MATVPTNWGYYDKSANKYLTAGQTMPTPGEGDQFYNIPTDTYPSYTYHDAHTYYYYNWDETAGDRWKQITVPAGWEAHTYASYTGTSFAPLSSVANKPVVLMDLYNCSTITTVTLHTNLRVAVTRECTNLVTVNGSVDSNLLYCYFAGCSKLKTVPNLSSATGVIFGRNMFSDCAALTSVAALPPNVEDVKYCFRNCVGLTSAPAIPSKVTSAGGVFTNCTALSIAPQNNSNIMQYIWGGFDGCTNLVDASAFTFCSSIIEMEYCFRNCTSLTTPPSIITGTNALAYRLFESCTSLVTPPSFEGSYSNMNTMFYKCSSLKTPPVIPNGSQTMSWMFAECTSLETVPYIPSTVTTLYYCFYKCTSLNWISIRLNNVYGSSFNSMFNGCTNLTGIVYLASSYVSSCSQMFYGTTKPIIIGGQETPASALAAQSDNNNVYMWLLANYSAIESTRTDALGNPDDLGEYMELSIDFVAPDINYSKIYVPKVYKKNDQLAPYQNWVLTYKDETETEIVKEIPNSTDITQQRIEANDLVTSGNFKTLFLADSLSEGASLTCYLPTSNSKVATAFNDSENEYTIGTFYWNGSRGEAVFTGETFIFDALPDGSAFKIGGAISEDETGFICALDAHFKDHSNIIRSLFDLFYPKYSYYETSLPAAIPSGESTPTDTDLAALGDTWFDPNYAWGGTWILETEGQVHVSAGSNYTIAGALTDTSDGGSEDAIIPYHNHSVNAVTSQGMSANTTHSHTIYGKYKKTCASGSSQNRVDSDGSSQTSGPYSASSANLAHTHTVPAHNTNYAGTSGNEVGANMQPYIVVNRWHRTA